MENDNLNKWPKAITVDKRIVRILSSSTYSNFPNAIKEIIINGYDADADNVFVDFNIEDEIISIYDDGKGMNENDFSFYLRIAGKSRKKRKITEKNRKIVGQFGVGFLSVLPFCHKYLIETTKKGSPEIVKATIISSDYFKEEINKIDVDRIPIDGGITIDESIRHISYTRIRLVGFSKLTKSFLNGEYTLEGKRNTVKKLKPLELFKWELQEYLPVKYDNRISIGNELNSLLNNYTKYEFHVFFNKKEIFRNIHAKKIIDITNESIDLGNIKFKYFIATNFAPLSPKEARYLLIRNLNVGVGDRTTFGLGLDGKVYGKLAHLTGEILIEEGLNELISVSRDKFNYSVEYEQLKKYFRKILRKIANDLDKIKSLEKLSAEFKDVSKVSSIKNLKKINIEQKIEKLIDTIEYNNKNDIEEKLTDIENIEDKKSKEHVDIDSLKSQLLSKITDNKQYKIINVGDETYSLKLDEWDFENSMFPALKFENDLIIVNEKYPIFNDKNKIDVFIKLNILLLNYLNDGYIEKNTYSLLMKDILNTF